jgi:hypothetical protein
LELVYIQGALLAPVSIRAAVPVGPPVGPPERVAPRAVLVGPVELLGVRPEPVWSRAEPQERVALLALLQVQLVRQVALEAVHHYPDACWAAFHGWAPVAQSVRSAVPLVLAHLDERWEPVARGVPPAVPLGLVRQDELPELVAPVVLESPGWIRGGC